MSAEDRLELVCAHILLRHGHGAGLVRRSSPRSQPVTSRDAANFRGLVLGGIEAKCCKYICV